MSEKLTPALRQYRHNNSDGFVFGYDLKETKEVISKLNREVEEGEDRLVNAFQLIKNGKQIKGLKFQEFKRLMNNTYNHNFIYFPNYQLL